MLPQLVDTGSQVLFHSPPGVLFTFPSQYCALSVTEEYLALRGGPRLFPQGFSCPVVLWILLCTLTLRVRGFHPLRPPFPGAFCCTYARLPQSRTPPCTHGGLGSSHSARRYFGNRSFFLFLRLLRCFSSPGIPPHSYGFTVRYIRSPYVGSPIQISADHCVFATPRSFSQLITSFFGSQCQGIRPVPFFAWPLPPAGCLA